MEGLKHNEVAVLMLPFPEQSHLNSLLHLSHLIASYQIPVHYAASGTHIRQATFRYQGYNNSDFSTNIHFHGFNDLPPHTSPPPKPDISTHFPMHLLPVFQASVHLRKPVCELLRELSLKFKRVVVIHDCNMASVVQDVRVIVPNAESYSFFGISAFSLFLMFWNGIADEKPFELLQSDIDPRSVPSDDGFIPPEIMKFVLEQFSFLGLECGRLYNTSRVLEPRFIELLEKLSGNSEIKHFAVGPFNPVCLSSTESGNDRHGCLEWLDKQEKNSVLYISFGSTTSMCEEQIAELAKGLERSGKKFVWVIRKADTGDVFAAGEEKKTDLPEGFEERTKSVGIVIQDWAPQLEILGHGSTGVFLSHCGWNSCIESISMGVPIAAWPMHSEQLQNAFLVSEVLKVGIMIRNWSNQGELVMSSTIENAITVIMGSNKGEEIRKRTAEVGDVVRASVAKGGASSLEMDSFIAHITR